MTKSQEIIKAVFTELETKVLCNLKEILEETEMVASIDLIFNEDDPKEMRGAIASLVKKGMLDIETHPSKVNDQKLYWVSWDEEAVANL